MPLDWKTNYWEKSKRLFDSPVEIRPHPLGEPGQQRIYRFDNGYGASIVRWMNPLSNGRLYGSYTSNEEQWELAVIKFSPMFGKDNFKFELTYKTPIANDVIGYLSEDEVEDYLQKIKNL